MVTDKIVEDAKLDKFLAEVSADNPTDTTNSQSVIGDRVVAENAPTSNNAAVVFPVDGKDSVAVATVQLVKVSAAADDKTNGLVKTTSANSAPGDDSKPQVEMKVIAATDEKTNGLVRA